MSKAKRFRITIQLLVETVDGFNAKIRTPQAYRTLIPASYEVLSGSEVVKLGQKVESTEVVKFRIRLDRTISTEHQISFPFLNRTYGIISVSEETPKGFTVPDTVILARIVH